MINSDDSLDALLDHPIAYRCHTPVMPSRRSTYRKDTFNLRMFVLRKQHTRAENLMRPLERMVRQPPALDDWATVAPLPSRKSPEINCGDFPDRPVSPTASCLGSWVPPTYVEVPAGSVERGPENLAETSWLDNIDQLERLSTRQLLARMEERLLGLKRRIQATIGAEREQTCSPLVASPQAVRSFGTFAVADPICA